jgi:TRAP-type mannitol/chloroaromatic compound transport system substrate-binding protein
LQEENQAVSKQPRRGIQGGSAMTVSRRKFAFAAAASGAAVASPAIAQQATIKWRMVSSFPKAIEGLWGATPTIAKFVNEMSDGKFVIDTFGPGEIVPGLQVLDAVSNGTVECGHTYSGYYIGKSPALIFDGSLPFGFTARQHNAWYMFGDGKKLIDEMYDGLGVVSIPCGNTGGQSFGWFRKELKTVADFNGIKMRVAGFGGRVMQKLGVVPQQIAGGDIYSALEKGTIDAAEWVGPHDDEKLGFHKVAKYLHIPGVLELCAVAELSGDAARGLRLCADGDARRIRRSQRQGGGAGCRARRAARRAAAGRSARATHRAGASARRGSR